MATEQFNGRGRNNSYFKEKTTFMNNHQKRVINHGRRFIKKVIYEEENTISQSAVALKNFLHPDVVQTFFNIFCKVCGWKIVQFTS